MQVSVQEKDQVTRVVSITVDASHVDTAREKRLQSIRQRVRIDGFRKGKAPLALITQRYGSEALSDAVDDVIRTSYVDALKDQHIMPIGTPAISIQSSFPLQKTLQFEATVEVYPDIALREFKTLSIQGVAVTAGESDIDRHIEMLQSNVGSWEAVSRAAKKDDQVIISYTGTIDGTPFAGGSAENVPYTLGSNRFFSEFESALVGMSADDTTSLSLTFPSDYHAAEVAGKEAVFSITVHTVEEQRLPVLDDAFAQKVGTPESTLATLRTNIGDMLNKQAENTTRETNKRAVFDALIAAHDFLLPPSLVASETDAMFEDYQKQQAEYKYRNTGDMLDRSHFHKEAEKRLKISLLLRTVIDTHAIATDAARVDAKIDTLVAHEKNAAAARRKITENADMMRRVQSLCLEEQVVDLILQSADVTYETHELTAFLQQNNHTS